MKNIYLKGGLNKNIIIFFNKNLIKNIINLKLKSLNLLFYFKLPDWGYLDVNIFNYNKIIYYSFVLNKIKIKPKTKKIIDIIFDSNSIILNINMFLLKQGIIYYSIYISIFFYIKLIVTYLNSVIFLYDNFYYIINNITFSEGSFLYILKNNLWVFNFNTYFITNTEGLAQFEKTLIIISKNSICYYTEGCSAPKFNESQLHIASVEIILKFNSVLFYYTIQNWYKGNIKGAGGVYNLTTKRGVTYKKAILYWCQIEIGSYYTWKYPSTLLLKIFSSTFFYSITFTSFLQKTDTGNKTFSLSYFNKVNILSKSVSINNSFNIFRCLISLNKLSLFNLCYIYCSSIIIGFNSFIVTLPYLNNNNYLSLFNQETYILKFNIIQMFMFSQRNISIKLSLNIILFNFFFSIYYKLPLSLFNEISYIIFLKFNESNF